MTGAPRLVVVAGGTGNVGEGIVRAFLADGATVLVPSRSAARLDALRGRLDPAVAGRLVTVAADIGSPDGATAIAERAEAAGPVEAVVAAIGGWYQGPPVIATDWATWQRVTHDILHTHFLAARALLPAMVARGRGTYVLINGFSAEEPYPGAGPVSVGAAGQQMLARMLMVELAESGVQVSQLVLGPVLSRSRTRGRPEWISADDVGDVCVGLADGRRAAGLHRVMTRDDL